MTVRPTPSDQPQRPGIRRTDRPVSPGVPVRPSEPATPPVSGTRGDEVQISSQARELQQLDAATRGPGGELSAARMKEVLSRLSDGHYDRPEVRDQVLRQLRKDL
jgi:hypothetical protein